MNLIMNSTLHSANFARIPLVGAIMRRRLETRSRQIASLTAHLPDPNVSVVIRSRNDSAYIGQLLADIRAQDFRGRIEIILVDTASTDQTVALARTQGAKVISLTQAEFTYPRALNLGFEAATHPYVITLVGHSTLASRTLLGA